MATLGDDLDGPRPSLPIGGLRGPFLRALARGPVVLTAPTGSGKSTEVPRWCPDPVLVIEPRRVACRGLAQRVAQLEDTELGGDVGYQVRDDRHVGERTRILFVTPGIALQRFAELKPFRTVIVDEFHERRLDTDLLLALLRGRVRSLVVMSATLDGKRVAAYLGGEHLHGEGRQFPVRVEHLSNSPDVPDLGDLVHRIARALRRASDDPGDVLVFLPGKSEIAATQAALAKESGIDVVPLHGGLSLAEQARAFESTNRRKVILATNVAETSVTIPGVGVVIDTGLVRRTRYHQGRGHLALAPIALDSANQRAGRAGRTAPGVCYRLWNPRAKLASRTPPEVHRESLVPLVLAAAACGSNADELQLLDPPKDHALESAKAELLHLGALDAAGGLTECGRQLFGLPIDAWLGKILVEARGEPALYDCIDLVAALSVQRPLFTGRPATENADLMASGCDLTACIRAVREGHPRRHGLDAHALRDARDAARRLRQALGVRETERTALDRDALIRIIVRADARCVHVPRTRRGRITWANGGTEIELARESAVHRRETVDAIVVLDTRAIGSAGKTGRVIATCATPVRLATLMKLGVGRDRVAKATLEDGRVIARIERVFAKRTIGVREEMPHGHLARAAVADLFLRGVVFPDALAQTRDRIAHTQLAAQLAHSGLLAGFEPPPCRGLEAWVDERIAKLGVESGDDLALLAPADLTAPDLPQEVRDRLEREFPLRVSVGDATYEAAYDLGRRQVILKLVHGHRRAPPPAAYLPRFGGFRVFAEAGGTMHRVR